MPLYVFTCGICGKTYEIMQKVDEAHEYICTICGSKCKRIFTPLQMKLNKGFFSVTLGKEVKSQTDFENKLEELRYMNDLNEYLGNNKKPKDEWIENRSLREQKVRERVKRIDELIDEENRKYGWYKSIETYKYEQES
ncbi:MAG: FmdB family zinc ribbon protein [bacterium]